MGKKLLLLLNPSAGKMKSRSSLFEIVNLFSSQGFEVTVYPTRSRGDATNEVLQRARNFDLVVCCGGDGTFNETMTGLLQLPDAPPMGYLPAGSTNDLAHSLHLSRNITKACLDILHGTEARLDVGQFNSSRYFAYVACFGAFSEASYATPQKTKNTLGHLAYVLEGIRSLPYIRSYHAVIKTDEGPLLEDDYIFAGVLNSTSMAGILKFDSHQVEFNDGKFELLLVKRPKNLIHMQKIVNGLLSQRYDMEYVQMRRVQEVTFALDKKASWSLDGEFGGDHSAVQIRNISQSLRIMLPLSPAQEQYTH